VIFFCESGGLEIVEKVKRAENFPLRCGKWGGNVENSVENVKTKKEKAEAYKEPEKRLPLISALP